MGRIGPYPSVEKKEKWKDWTLPRVEKNKKWEGLNLAHRLKMVEKGRIRPYPSVKKNEKWKGRDLAIG